MPPSSSSSSCGLDILLPSVIKVAGGGRQAGWGGLGGGAEAAAAPAAPAAQVKRTPLIQGIRFKKEDGTEVYAYPENGRVPALSYVLYRWEDSFHRKAPDASSVVIGRTGAKKDGSISKVGLLWFSS